MKTFNLFLIESQSGSIIPSRKFWFKSGGGFIPTEDSMHFHHIHTIANHPEKFDMTEKDILKMKPFGKLSHYKSGVTPWDDNVISGMNNRGHFRGMYKFDKSDTFSPHHDFSLSDDRSWIGGFNYKPENLDNYNDHLKYISNSIPDGHKASVSIEINTGSFSNDLIEKLQKKHRASVEDNGVTFSNKHSLDSYLSDIQAKNQRDVKNNTSNVTGQDIRAALGKKPEAMTRAEWNFFRTIGDSYTIKTFKTFLLEQEDFDQFLQAHFGQEAAKSPVVKSKFSGQPHPSDIPVLTHVPVISTDPNDPDAIHRWADRVRMGDSKNPAYRVHPEQTTLKFHSEQIRTHPETGQKYHIVRYDANDAERQMATLSAEHKKVQPHKKGNVTLIQRPLPRFVNNPWTPDRGLPGVAPSIGSILTAAHGLKGYDLAADHGMMNDTDRNLLSDNIVTYAAKIPKKKDGDGGNDPQKSPEPKPDLSYDLTSGSSRRKPVLA